MIIFKTLRFKNILSTGDNWSSIDLSASPSTLIVGNNGSGKSTILDALSFALFNKPHRKINKPQLVNTVNNGGLEVQIEFTTKGSDYLIRRGIKPNLFEIYKNGKAINQLSRSVDYQSVLENSILGMSIKAFNQIVVLGASSFTPFMQLAAHDRRHVIEDLLDINIFSRMSELLKSDMAKLKESLTGIEHNESLIRAKLDAQERYIDKIKANQSVAIEDNRVIITKYRQEIADLEEANKGLEEARKARSDSLALRQKEEARKDKLEAYRYRFAADLRDLEQKIAFYRDHNECPTCSQEISDYSKNHYIAQAQEKKKEREDAIRKIDGEVESKNQAIAQHNKAIEAAQSRLTTLQVNEHSIANLNSQIAAVEKRIDSLKVRGDIEEAVKEFNDATKQLEDVVAERVAAKEEQDYGSAIARMLKDDGIRSKIIQESLPLINKTINQHLNILDLGIQFDLNSTFNETIGARHREGHSYMSLSEGERMRVDLSILFAWRMIAKRRATVDCNLMILDEVLDSSLDSYSLDNLFRIFRAIEKDTNLVVISHRSDGIDDHFYRKVTCQCEPGKNFNTMTITT